MVVGMVALLAACTPYQPSPQQTAPKPTEPAGAAPQATAQPPAAQPAATTAPAAPAAKAEPKAPRPFTFILDFVPSGEYTPYYTALEKGWYREEGLDVRILRGAGSGDTVKRIMAGQGDAGSADFSALVAARANEDVAARAIGAYYRRPPHSIFVLNDSPITTPKDLEGKSLGISAGNSHQLLFPLFAQKAGFDPDSVTWVTMDATAMGPSLVSKSVDAVPFFAVHETRINKIAQAQGNSIRVMARYSDYGLDMYSLSIFSRDELVSRDPEPLKAFLRATYRGMRYAYAPENIQETIQYVLKEVPDLDSDGAAGGARVASTFAMTEEITSNKVAMGQFEPDRVTRSRDIYTEALKLRRSVPLEDLYTNELLPERR
jgi:NitT/TauT family transport system substrate-binding protein